MKAWILVGAGALILAGAALFAVAHKTGHESRTVADCEKLPGTQAAGERAQCLRCVERPINTTTTRTIRRGIAAAPTTASRNPSTSARGGGSAGVRPALLITRQVRARHMLHIQP